MIKQPIESTNFGLFISNFAFSLFGWLATSICLVYFGDNLTQHYYQPGLIVIVHAFTLMTVSPAIKGSLFQLLPVITEAPLASRSFAWLSSVFWWIGSAGFVLSRLFADSFIIYFALILFFSILIDLYLTGSATFQGKLVLPALLVFVAVFWLAIMAISGFFMAANYTGTVSRMNVLQWHAWTGITGWFFLMIIALGSRLVPMFFLSHGISEKWAIASGVLTALFPVFLIGSLWIDGLFFYPPFILVIVSFFLFAKYLFGCYQKRLRKNLESPLYFFLASFFFVPAALIIAVWIPLPSYKTASMVVIAILGGFVGGATLAMSFKILPFMGWMQLQAKSENRKETMAILPQSLGLPVIYRIIFVVYPVSILLLISGVEFGRLLPFAMIGLLICVLLNIYSFVNILMIIYRRRL